MENFNYQKGSEWRKWDLQVQTILDDGYVSIGEYWDDLKSRFPDKCNTLVQMVGSKTFSISGHNLALNKSTKDKITKLKNLKLQYFDNKSDCRVGIRQLFINIHRSTVICTTKHFTSRWLY